MAKKQKDSINMNDKKRVKFSMRIEPDCFEEELLYARQIGCDGVYCWLRDEHLKPDAVGRIRERVERAGLTLFTAHNYRLCKNPDIQLGRDGRDKAIEEYCKMLEILGAAGIPSTNFTWEPTYTKFWDHPEPQYIREAETRYVDEDEIAERPLLYDRTYEREALWENMKYFLDIALPAAESAGVGMALHPNDPPIDSGGGIPFLIRGKADYERAFSLHPSPNLGMELCIGCWAEGKERFGDPVSGIRDYLSTDRVMVIHFRNVSAPLPRFKETYIDNGYLDLWPIARVIAESGYDRSLILDHVPVVHNKLYSAAPLAYSMGYVRAMFDQLYS